MPDSDLLQWLSAHLVALGPGVLFVTCLLETAIFAGLVLPVGALIAFAAMLASRGLLDPAQVVAAAFFGALIGDQLGFVVGRWFVSGARPPRGRVARLWQGTMVQTQALVRKRGLLGVSVARAIPFARTIMPWFAGRSGVGWGRFFLFDLLGVTLWGSIYIGGGFLAGEGWRQLAGLFGEMVGGVLVLIVAVGVVALARARVRRAMSQRFSADPASTTPLTAEDAEHAD